MRALKVVAVGLLLAANVTALAQQEADKVVFKKKTVIDFSDVTIEGELTKPEGSYIVNRKKTKFRNLIQVRGHFRNELTKSVDAL
jgi:hypothetical protein